jgi:hypothetical protein
MLNPVIVVGAFIYLEVIDISEILLRILGVSADIATAVMFVDYIRNKIR